MKTRTVYAKKIVAFLLCAGLIGGIFPVGGDYEEVFAGAGTSMKIHAIYQGRPKNSEGFYDGGDAVLIESKGRISEFASSPER